MRVCVPVGRTPHPGTLGAGQLCGLPDTLRKHEPDRVRGFVGTSNDRLRTGHYRIRAGHCRPDAVQALEPAA